MNGSRQVLLVEDDTFLSTFMSLVLEAEGYAVSSAYNGREALDLIQEKGLPDLIMLDMKMPIMDGKAFALEFRRLYDTQRPLVVMTAADDAEQRAHDLGITSYLAKPFGIPELISLVKEKLRLVGEAAAHP